MAEYSPAVVGEVEPPVGLGARLAELQAISGGFSTVPVDTDASDAGFNRDGRPQRGMWEPKTPAVPSGDVDVDVDLDSEVEVDGATTESAEFDDAPPYRPEPSVDNLPPLEPINIEPTQSFVIRGATESASDLNGYEPANSTEEDLLAAARAGNTDGFLSTLLLAKVLVPGNTVDPVLWPTEEINGARYLVAYTSPQRIAERRSQVESQSDALENPEAATVRFTSLIARWPGDDLGFAVNPGTPVGASLTGEEVRTLAGWAVEVGLIDGLEQEPAPVTPPPPAPEPRPTPRPSAGPTPGQPLTMQRAVAAAQVPLYLDRGYDRVSGFVHRASEIDHIRTPLQLYRALGLIYPGSPFQPDDTEVYVLRWPAFCPSLYRIPFGGQNEAGMQAMQGWVIERPPFRGNGFAPSETGDVVAEFKVDSTRLPHGAQLWRLTRDGVETLVALFDADGPRWRRVGSNGGGNDDAGS